jgi:hypothetical protein
MSKETAPALTAEYIENHALTVHTMESFGRTLVAYALSQAQKQAAKAGTPPSQIEVSIPLVVKPTLQGCVSVHIPGGEGGFHISNAI